MEDERTSICTECNGTGDFHPWDDDKCPDCEGKGVIKY